MSYRRQGKFEGTEVSVEFRWGLDLSINVGNSSFLEGPGFRVAGYTDNTLGVMYLQRDGAENSIPHEVSHVLGLGDSTAIQGSVPNVGFKGYIVNGVPDITTYAPSRAVTVHSLDLILQEAW